MASPKKVFRVYYTCPASESEYGDEPMTYHYADCKTLEEAKALVASRKKPRRYSIKEVENRSEVELLRDSLNAK